MADRVPLTGRAREQALITGLLADATARGATLVIRGTPGAGKSTLLEWASATAGDRFLVLRATGTAAEFGLPFAALHQVVRPVLSHSIRLPGHRREALDVAFGKESDSPPDPAAPQARQGGGRGVLVLRQAGRRRPAAGRRARRVHLR